MSKMSALMALNMRSLMVLIIALTLIELIHCSPKKGKKNDQGEKPHDKPSARSKKKSEHEEMAKEDGVDAEDDVDGQEEFRKLEKKFKENVKKIKDMGVNWDDLKPKNQKKIDDMLKETAKNSKHSLDNPVERHGADEDDEDEGEGEDGGDDNKGKKDKKGKKEEKEEKGADDGDGGEE